MKISLVFVKSHLLTVDSASIYIFVSLNYFCHFSSTSMLYYMILMASEGFCLKIRLMSIIARTLSQISFEIDSRRSSILFSLVLICREMVQISFKPDKRDGKVSSITVSSPRVKFLNYLSRVVKNLTKSLALACSLENLTHSCLYDPRLTESFI